MDSRIPEVPLPSVSLCALSLLSANLILMQEDNPSITDAEYDALQLRSTELEKRFPGLVGPTSPSARIGSVLPEAKISQHGHEQQDPAEGAIDALSIKAVTGESSGTRVRLPYVRHLQPLHSLDNVFDDEKARDFVKRVSRAVDVATLGEAESALEGQGAESENGAHAAGTPPEAKFMAEPKIDGLTCALLYENGRLVRAATRGDGISGEDVTANAMMLGESGVPHRLRTTPGALLPTCLEVRGEIYMPEESFVRVNSERERQGLPPFASARNAAAGSLRLLDADVTRERKLGFFAYGAAIADDGSGGCEAVKGGKEVTQTAPTSLADVFGTQARAYNSSC